MFHPVSLCWNAFFFVFCECTNFVSLYLFVALLSFSYLLKYYVSLATVLLYLFCWLLSYTY